MRPEVHTHARTGERTRTNTHVHTQHTHDDICSFLCISIIVVGVGYARIRKYKVYVRITHKSTYIVMCSDVCDCV
jgi:hypothetical protein